MKLTKRGDFGKGMGTGKEKSKRVLGAFTLVELIVVITILAILATVWFLSLSGYSDDARTATVKANVRTVYSAILTESTTTGNSPRYYVNHDTGAALSGAFAFAFADGNLVALVGGQFGDPGTNYSAGNPRWDRLRMNGDKFKFALMRQEGFGTLGTDAFAAYSTGELAVGAVDIFKTLANGRKRNAPFFQVTAVEPGSKTPVVAGNYTPGAGAGSPGLVADSTSPIPSAPLTEPRTVATIVGDDTAGRKWSDGTVAKSCLAYASSPAGRSYAGAVGNGTYVIDPDGAGGNPELKVYCDMTTDGGGYTMYPITGGAQTCKYTDADSCKAIGLNLAVPRTKTHWISMFNKYGAGYFAIVPGIYSTVGGKDYTRTGCLMRDPVKYGSGCPDWQAIDGGTWWIRDTPYSEPNGDYTAGAWLGHRGISVAAIEAGQPFNDQGTTYCATSYICSTNDK